MKWSIHRTFFRSCWRCSGLQHNDCCRPMKKEGKGAEETLIKAKETLSMTRAKAAWRMVVLGLFFSSLTTSYTGARLM